MGKDNLEGKTGQDRGGSQQQAKQVLLEAQLDALERLSSVLDHGQLDDDGGNDDDQEELVVEEVLKDVVLVVLQLSGVDLVEDLKQHEHVEEDGVMLSCLLVPLADSDR